MLAYIFCKIVPLTLSLFPPFIWSNHLSQSYSCFDIKFLKIRLIVLFGFSIQSIKLKPDLLNIEAPLLLHCLHRKSYLKFVLHYKELFDLLAKYLLLLDPNISSPMLNNQLSSHDHLTRKFFKFSSVITQLIFSYLSSGPSSLTNS